MLYHDPALVFRCDVPWGWCLDGESSLFRIVFRPWDRLDERLIVTAHPESTTPHGSNSEWSAAIDAETPFEASRSMRLAAGTARLFHPGEIDGRRIRRIVRRGGAFDLTIDHLYAGGSQDEPAPAHLRIAASTRAPILPLLREPSPPLPLEEASKAVTSLPESATAEDYFRALAAEELSAKTAWIKSLRHGRVERIDTGAFTALLRSRAMKASIGIDLWLLLQAHGMILRIVPSQAPTTPYTSSFEMVRPPIYEACAEAHPFICSVLRRHPKAPSTTETPDDVFGSRTYLQQLMARLLTDEARNHFQKGERVRHEALADALLAHLYAMGRWAHTEKPWPAGPVVGEIWGLGRALTAYSDAALNADDVGAALEAAEGLRDVGARLMATPDDDPDAETCRKEGLTYTATAACAVTSVLTRSGDQASLQRALGVVDDTLGLLRKVPGALVERTNIAHYEVVAALQLGDVSRVREAIERGIAAATRINSDHQVKFFAWAKGLAELIANRPAAVHSLPDLQYERWVADGGADEALQRVCSALEREMADDIASITTIERLSLAARSLGPLSGSDAVLAAAEGLMNVRRLLLSGRSDLQIGQDDSLLSRNLGSSRVAHLAGSGEHLAAVLATDCVRAQALLAEFVLSPGETEELREVVANAANPGQPMAFEAAMRERVPENMRRISPVAPWSGPHPFGALRASAWLTKHANRTREWVHQVLSPFGVRSLTAAELLETVKTLGHPVLVLHPTGDRIALFLVMTDATIHHAMSGMTTSDVHEHVKTFRRNDASLTDFHAAAGALYGALIAPLKLHVSAHESLTITPYRELSAIPFALLEDETSTPLVERCAVSVVPSIATLSLLRYRTRDSEGPAKALVVGDPATTRLPRLPGAASEARGVEARLRAAHPEMALQLLLDTEATPAAFLQHARGAQLLHLACHAVVDDAAQQSALYLAEDATGDDRLDRPDILRAPLNDALVFLSACRSGAGQAAAEGTLGLARDFLRAGARAVVASHWNVPDDVTATLVEHFYTSFVGTNRDVGTALRMAMLATRWELEHTGKKRRPAAHPADWGGFFVLGDGSLRDAPMVTA